MSVDDIAVLPEPRRRMRASAHLAPVRSWWQRRRLRRECLHHQPSTGETYIRFRLIDSGARKLVTCRACGRCWIW